MLNLQSGWTFRSPGIIAAQAVGGVAVSARYYYVGLAILVVLLVFALIKAYRTWEEIHEDLEPDSPHDLLESFEEAHAAGELNDEELERLRQRLGAAKYSPGSELQRSASEEKPSTVDELGLDREP
jgi:uncharacterized membrane protein